MIRTHLRRAAAPLPLKLAPLKPVPLKLTPLALAALALTTVGLTIGAVPARAEGYPFCPPKEDADCYLLNRINENISPVQAGDEARLIAEGHRACEFMASDHSGTNPMLDYGVWVAQQPGRDKSVITDAAQFAMYAAKAYCPTVLP